MAEILSQEEIDALLQALSTGEVDVEAARKEEQRKVKVYDFRRPDKFSKDQLRAMQMIHETFSRLFTTVLSADIRSMVQVKVASADQIAYEEFIKSLINPTVLGLFEMRPLEGKGLIEINPSLVFSVIDRMFGGRGEPLKKMRELTEIEQGVIEKLLLRLLDALEESWRNVVEVTFHLVGMETNPLFAQVAPSTDMVVVVTFTTKVGEVEGMMNICFPYILLEPIIPKLSAQYWFSSTKTESTEADIESIKSKLESLYLPVKAVLGETVLTIGDVLNLEVGDIIKLDKKVTMPCDVHVVDKRKFKGRVGTVGNRLAVQILEISPEEEE